MYRGSECRVAGLGVGSGFGGDSVTSRSFASKVASLGHLQKNEE